MAGLRAQQGDVAGAMDLYGQSLAIKEQIGNVRGKAATLANLAGLLHQSGDVAGATAHLKQAALILAAMQAWPDLLVVLDNLAIVDAAKRLLWTVQAAWLVLALRRLDSQSLRIIANLFHRLPSADRLELPVSAIHLYFARQEAESEEAVDASLQLFAVAAENHSLSEEAAIQWLREKLDNPVISDPRSPSVA